MTAYIRKLKANQKWRRCANPSPKIWPGPWVEFRWYSDQFGRCHVSMLDTYLGEERAGRIRAALSAGKRAGRFDTQVFGGAQ